MKRYILTSLSWSTFIMLHCFCHHSSAQTLSGKVLESTGKGLPYVNVLLLKDLDSTMVRAAITDTAGTYVIRDIPAGTYVLSASLIGYSKRYSNNIEIGAGIGITNAPAITLSDDGILLKEVAITAQRPFIENKIDRMVVNVANSIISSGTTALELLEKLPGVSVDKQNDIVQMLGKEGVIIQINGKQTYLSGQDVVSLLRNTTSENIDKIELITNPSARNDASGNSGIINIVLKRNEKLGTSGTIAVGVGTGRFDRERGSLQISHRGNKLNLFGNYAANHGGNYFDLHTRREVIDGPRSNVAYQNTFVRTPDTGQNAKLGLQYAPTKNTTIGLNWTGFWNKRREKGKAASAFSKKDGEEIYLDAQTGKLVSNDLSNQIGNLNIEHTFKDDNGLISIDVDGGHFKRDFSSALTTVITEASDSPYDDGLFTKMPTIINVFAGKIDYSRAISKGLKMEAGGKWSSVKTESDLTISRGNEDNVQVDPSLSNHFRYVEEITAAYLNVSGKILNGVELQAGLRMEHTNSVAESITTGVVVKRNYLDLFPTLFLSKALSSKHTLTFSYSRRIDRPNYQNLNPGRSYIDPYLFSEGNPYLKPQYTHSLELRHGFKGIVFTSITASFEDPFVWTFIQPVDSLQSKRIPLNVGRANQFTAAINFPLTITKKWTLQLSVFGIYSKYKYLFLDIPQESEQLTARLNGSNSIILGQGWTGEISGWVNAPAVTTIYHNPWLGSLDLGIQKAINNTMKIKLTVQDILHTNKAISRVEAPGFLRTNHLAFDTRVVMLNLTYNFGNQKLKSTQQRRSGADDELRRTN